MSEIAAWQGDFGNEYTERNVVSDMLGRTVLWRELLDYFNSRPTTILEIGAGCGDNLSAILRAGHNRCDLAGVEPNRKARAALKRRDFGAYDGTAQNPGRTADFVFTSGVLIHIPPDELMAAYQGIYDAAERYIVSIEYFAADPEEKLYRGRKLWKRDFGAFWLDNFDLKPLGCGFAWKRTTGLDNLTWWAFAK